MKYLGLELPALVEKGAIHTAREICQQPELWQTIWAEMRRQGPDLQQFLGVALKKSTRIIVTGAGTSSFIGLSVAGLFQRKTGLLTQSIATTDLVSHPMDYIQPGVPVCVISFARSGNSPESVAAVSLIEEISGDCYHLVITCNRQGNLASHGSDDRKYVLSLPEEANDQSLAMTSSYTGMLLAALLVTELANLDEMKRTVDVLTGYGRKIINYYADKLAEIAATEFHRAVFLGSGPLFGTARESHLKLQELTDGRIICKEESFLGLRHGPKAVIDGTTLVCYIFSNEKYVSRYERDLVSSMKKGQSPLLEMGIMETIMPGTPLDHVLYLSENGSLLREEYLAVCSVLPAQILGFFKSLQLGLRPDTPSQSGAITRVVEGVQIYDLKA